MNLGTHGQEFGKTVPERYNIRVYGVCLRSDGKVLLTDERRSGYPMTKFPGGGHDFGEGLADALRREFLEEADTEIEIRDLLYINDFLQISAFNPKDQLLSVYYHVDLVGELNAPTTDVALDFGSDAGDVQTFRWAALANLLEDELTFPVDKVVLGILKQRFL